MCNLYRGPSIDASNKVSVHLAKGFQMRRSKCEKLMDDRRRMPSDGKSSHCLWQGELKILHTQMRYHYLYGFKVMIHDKRHAVINHRDSGHVQESDGDYNFKFMSVISCLLGSNTTPGHRFTNVIVNRKSKITLKISLRAHTYTCVSLCLSVIDPCVPLLLWLL